MGRKTTSEVEIVGVRGAAEILGLSERQVQQHAKNGTLPGRKLGARAWVFVRADVAALKGKLPKPGWKKGRPRPRNPA